MPNEIVGSTGRRVEEKNPGGRSEPGSYGSKEVIDVNRWRQDASALRRMSPIPG